jgi:hypothetical protein
MSTREEKVLSGDGFGERRAFKAVDVIYWLYAALFKRRYSGSVETVLDQDIRAPLDDPNLDLLIGNLKEDEGDPVVSPSNLDMRWVGHPLYNMMKIVLRANEAVDRERQEKSNSRPGSAAAVEVTILREPSLRPWLACLMPREENCSSEWRMMEPS